jgi:hypothetical protein
MSIRAYVIDTNIVIGLEGNHAVQPAFAELTAIAARHKIDILVHEAARDDVARDRDVIRRDISLSKISKFQVLEKVRGLNRHILESHFGRLSDDNDVVDATLLHAILIGAADFLVTEDKRLHQRARRHSTDIGSRVLFAADAVSLLKTTYEPIDVPVRYVEEVSAHMIPLEDALFDGLREDYPSFDDWWRSKCVKERRPCWVVYDGNLAGLIVRKDESGTNTVAKNLAGKILKICTFKVRPEKRGVKLGELLLKKAFWYSQKNNYQLMYLTVYKKQESLIDLIEFYGFQCMGQQGNGELIYEKSFSSGPLIVRDQEDKFELARLNYPRFVTHGDVRAFGVPIKEEYHDVLFPDLRNVDQADLFEFSGMTGGPRRPGNTIRKVYLCRSQSNVGPPGSLLFFYKGQSKTPPSQSLTAIGVFEGLSVARSLRDLMVMTGGRSVYSEASLRAWNASQERPVKVLNFLLTGYIDPPVGIEDLRSDNVFGQHPPQSIFEISNTGLQSILRRVNLGFSM